MKKILLILILIIPLLNTQAQEDDPYLIRMDVLKIEGNTGAFIQANKDYYKLLAIQAVKDGKWAGWAMFRSFSERNVFVFFHHLSLIHI